MTTPKLAQQINSSQVMTKQRYEALTLDDSLKLTKEEMLAGWHFCNEFDGLLVGPGMEGELSVCTCHNTPEKIGKAWIENSSLENWFPISAEQIKTLEQERNTLKQQLTDLTACLEWADKNVVPFRGVSRFGWLAWVKDTGYHGPTLLQALTTAYENRDKTI